MSAVYTKLVFKKWANIGAIVWATVSNASFLFSLFSFTNKLLSTNVNNNEHPPPLLQASACKFACRCSMTNQWWEGGITGIMTRITRAPSTNSHYCEQLLTGWTAGAIMTSGHLKANDRWSNMWRQWQMTGRRGKWWQGEGVLTGNEQGERRWWWMTRSGGEGYHYDNEWLHTTCPQPHKQLLVG